MTLPGLIMDKPWMISSIIEHAARHHTATEILARTIESGLHRYTDGQAHDRIRQLAHAVTRLGIQLTDRSKDVIKSDGEWISSIDLENVAVGHPKVMQAAVIAVPHPKWQERPLLIIVRKPGSTLDAPQMLNFMRGKVVDWWLPDDVVFVEQMPMTGTGKVHKLSLRQQFSRYVLPGDGPA